MASEIPPPPPGFSVDTERTKPKRQPARTAEGSAPPPPPGFVLDDAEVLDADTLRSGDQTIRLWGADAPELGQSGWTREGQAVPVGQQARQATVNAIGDTAPVMGVPAGTSYGRTVAPVTIGDEDLAEQLVREGQALAAPGYLITDPDRRFDYLQAERLARLNALGVHDYFMQPPAEHRANPGYVPLRQDIAQFFDTPTPIAGMSPAAEKRYLDLLNTAKTPDEIVSFVESQGGFKLDPKAVEGWIRARDTARSRGDNFSAKGGVTYDVQPMPLTDSGDGASGAGVRGYGQGWVAGALDELGAFPDMLGGTSGRENVWNSDRRLADIWYNNQQQNASILGYDEFAHPYAYKTGQVAGALTSGFVIPYGQGARTIPQLARVGAVYGGIEGFMGTNGGLADRAEGAAIGVPLGAALNAGGGKLLELGAPVVAKGWRALTGKAAQQVDDVAAGAGETFLHTGSRETEEALDEIPPPPPGFTRDNPVREMAMDADPMATVSSELRQPDKIDPAARPQRLDQPVSDAQLAAASERIEPRDVLPIPANQVASVDEAAAAQAGRIVPAKAPPERDALTSKAVRNFAGVDVPKVGPVDLVGFLRLRGGIDDAGDSISKGGDLRAMGITSNASRKGLDFVGQEHRFGPIVREGGMSLDDAAEAAWEAGYFPELTERPTVNQFLGALDETNRGGQGRRFLPEDLGEIDTFYGRQAERFDLEQQQHDAGGQVYVDRSVPADEHAPFPPAEAYEEWPSEAISRAGNIDLRKLDTPQDIRRALRTTHDRVGFDAATRGRVTHAETERLASDMNMTADQLLARRKGQTLNAEEALAARQILAKSGNELVNAARRIQSLDEPGDELLAEFRRKWMRHVAIQEQVAGATAEAGRALQQFRMAASSGAVRGDVLGALVRGGGGKDGLKNAAETLIDAVEAGPGVFNALAQKAARPKFRHKLAELYINMLLSGPQTHAVNVASNTLTSIAQIPEHAAGALIGGARQAFSRASLDRVTGTEVGARAFGLLQGAKEGARLFARAIKTGEAADFVTKIEGDEFKAISGLKGEVVRIPTRLLTAEDELFKGIARRMELNAQAVRIARDEGLKGEARRNRVAELVADPTDEMLDHAMDYGRYLTFQRPLGPIASKVSAITNDSLFVKLFLPFVRTPTNLLKFAAERSPVAPVMREWRKDFAAGGARRDMAVARAVLGTGLGFAIYEAALAGKITGSAPTDPKKSRLLYADGWKPYSIRIGDTWYSYRRFDPFSTTMGVAADLATLPEGMSQRQRDDKATLFVASIMGNLANKTWLSGLSDVIGALDDPERNAGGLLERLAGSLTVPTGVNQVTRIIDPVQRETESVGEAIQNRIPGLSDNLLPRRDIWGQIIASEGGVGPDIVSPVWQSKALQDPVNSELLKLDYAPGYPSKTVGGKELTGEQYDRYQAEAGQLAHDRLTDLVTGQGWKQLDETQRIKLARKTVAEARRDVRARMFDDSSDDQAELDDEDILTSSARSGNGAPPPPPGFTVEGEAGGSNVYRDLQSAIPGVRFTSGFRTPEYQEQMRARGYRPAQNSAHLDGSALDMLPPPGKSLGWLRREISRLRPDAHLLVHDGHLHAEFPGYYGAPPLEGARTAGARNPLAGMPPPPLGFALD